MPYPIHDWLDTQYYFDLIKKEVSPNQWGWEFLRRNHDYQAEVERFNSFPDAIGGRDKGKWSDAIFPGRFYVDMFSHADPPAHPGENLADYFKRCLPCTIQSYAGYLRESFHLSSLNNQVHDPQTEYASIGWIAFDQKSLLKPLSRRRSDNFRPADINPKSKTQPFFNLWEGESDAIQRENTRRIKDYYEFMTDQHSDKTTRFYSFSLSTSKKKKNQLKEINAQLEAVKASLLKEQEDFSDYDRPAYIQQKTKTRKATPESYAVYLRILDAMAAKIEDPADIASVLYPKTEFNSGINRIEKAISTAIRLRDSDYWKL